MRDEGVIKFQCEWIQAAAPYLQEIEELNSWRTMLFQSGLIGVYPDGIGFGNISCRFGGTDQFWITGTQTGHLPELTPEHYTRVTDYSIQANKVTCKGPAKASSESLTHALIYETDHRIHAIVHVHHAKLWNALKNKVPTTSSAVPYGTPQMAFAVKSLYEHGDLAAQKILVMAGHEDGLISFGQTLMEAAGIMLGYWRQV